MIVVTMDGTVYLVDDTEANRFLIQAAIAEIDTTDDGKHLPNMAALEDLLNHSIQPTEYGITDATALANITGDW